MDSGYHRLRRMIMTMKRLEGMAFELAQFFCPHRGSAFNRAAVSGETFGRLL
jgi:hypothetical protein